MTYLQSSLEMMRQGQKTDTIKLCVHLISRLKKGEEVSLSNKLLSTELKNIPNKLIKLMIEVESLNYDSSATEQAQSLADDILYLKNQSKKESSETKIYSLLRLKVYAAALSSSLHKNNKDLINRFSVALLKEITNIEELRFVLQTMFRIRSLISLLSLSLQRVRDRWKGQKQLTKILFILAMIKATTSFEEAAKILKSINQKEQLLKEKSPLIDFLCELIKKQKHLMTIRPEEQSLVERSFMPIDTSTMKLIKNSIQNQCRIVIEDDNPSSTFARLNSIDQGLYLHAFPLTHLYFQKNPEILESVKSTELFKRLITSKSLLIQNNLNTSNNSNLSYLTNKKKPKKNPNIYPQYLKSDELAQSRITSVCEEGLLFTKHNFGNLKSSTKFVRVSKDYLEYYKNPDASDSGTRWNFEQILCVVYGRATPRQLENEVDPSLCFSVVLKDRTFDLSVQSLERLPELISFVRGLSYLLNRYHQKAKEEAEEALKTAKKSASKKLSEIAIFHEGKVQRITKGRLLWTGLMLSLNHRIHSSQDGRSKLEGIKKLHHS